MFRDIISRWDPNWPVQGRSLSLLVVSGVIVLLGLLLARPGFAQALGDPTRPPAVYSLGALPSVAEEKVVEWQLSSILIGVERSLATVNGKLVGPGDSVDGARVESIQRGGVTLDSSGTQIRLILVPSLRK